MPGGMAMVRLFLALALLGFTLAAGVVWLRRGNAGASDGPRDVADPDGPAAVFAEVQRAILAGDGDALWRRMDARARGKFERFVADTLRGEPDGKDARAYRALLSLSREDGLRRPAREILRREGEVTAETHYRGARATRVVPAGPDEAVLYMTLRSGQERQWHMVRVDGAWWIHDLTPLLSPEGRILDGRHPDDLPGVPGVPPGGRPSGGR